MSATEPHLHPKYVRAKALGHEITELFGYITAAKWLSPRAARSV